jgi:septum formation protein
LTRPLILASSSPRRRELLGRLGIPFVIVVPDVDERALPGEEPADHVRRLAAEKAGAVAAAADQSVVLAADTVVVLDNKIIGKPADAAEARRFLAALSGRTHTVYTGVAVLAGRATKAQTDVVASNVAIARLSKGQIEDYVATGEPLDKAGAYAVQGSGGRFVTSVDGSLTNVIGLPLRETHRLLGAAGCPSKLPREGL